MCVAVTDIGGISLLLDPQAEGGTVMVDSRSSRGGRVAVKVLTQWKEGIEVCMYI